MGADPPDPQPRGHHRPGHPLHGRGRTAVRPHRAHRRRPHCGDRHPRRPDCPNRCRGRRPALSRGCRSCPDQSVARHRDGVTMSALAKLITTESKLFIREPVGAFFTLAFPAVLVLVLGSTIPAFREPAEDIGGQRPIEVYLPITLAMAIATVTMLTLLATLSAYREKGVLRRLSATPVSPAMLLGAQLVVNLGALVI